MKKVLIIFSLLLSFRLSAQVKQMNACIVFYTPQTDTCYSGNLFLSGMIKPGLAHTDTCLIQYTSHRLTKIKAIIWRLDPSIISRIDTIDSDVVSDVTGIKYKRLSISGTLDYVGKKKTTLLTANNKTISRKIKTYTIQHITLDAACYRLSCGNNSRGIF